MMLTPTLIEKTFQWKKLGFVYVANGELGPWAQTHAYLPTSFLLNDDIIRVFVAFLDKNKVGRIGYVDVEAADPTRIIQVSKTPVLNIGEPGAFDDNGVTPASLVWHDNQLYLYYIGWQLGAKIPYSLFMGLAVSQDNGQTFVRMSQTPILDRSDEALFVRSAGFVLKEADTLWKMWYVTGSRWIEAHGRKVPTYNMRYLESENGTEWGKQGQVCLDLDLPNEYGFGRPFVIKEADHYQLWYSIRSHDQGYRIGFATSPDGKQWLRQDDKAGINVSPMGWDSQMIHCSCIQQTRYGKYLFYNGNNYGETGFGVAVLED